MHVPEWLALPDWVVSKMWIPVVILIGLFIAWIVWYGFRLERERDREWRNR